MLAALNLLLVIFLLSGFYLLSTNNSPTQLWDTVTGQINSTASNTGTLLPSCGPVGNQSSPELTTKQLATIYGNDRSMIERIHQGPQDHFGNLDGNLYDKGGVYHEVTCNNRFICQDCRKCSPASYQNDVDERFLNPSLHTQLRKVRTDEFPQYQLN